jgi:hypothetical protein
MSPHDLNPIVIPIVIFVAGLFGLTMYALPRWAPLLLDLLARGGRPLPPSSARADDDSTDTATPVAPVSESNWRWARRIEADTRIAEAALRKKEAAAISALEENEVQ